MSTTVKRKIPLIEDLMKKRKQIREEKEQARREGRQQGLQEGREEGQQQGLQEGRQEAKVEGAKNLIVMTDFTDEQIAEIQELPIEAVRELRKEVQL